MDIKAFKMDGLGNDFVIIDNRQKITNLTKEQIIKICNRNFLGCDQLILIERDKSADAFIKFYNSDGGESGACGNGTRCVADLISKEVNNKSIVLKTISGYLKSEISFFYSLEMVGSHRPYLLVKLFSLLSSNFC